MSYRFIGNMIDFNRPDAVDKVVSENYGKRKSRRRIETEDQVDQDGFVLATKVTPIKPAEEVLSYLQNEWMKNKVVGKPKPPANSTLTEEDLINMGYVGIYEKVEASRRNAAPSAGTGVSADTYPKIARYGSNGEVVEVISGKHTC